MPENPSSSTWISIDDRPPPLTRLEPDSPDEVPVCWVWFKLAGADDTERRLGFYLGEGRVHLAGENPRQPSLLIQATHWQPFDEAALREAEHA